MLHTFVLLLLRDFRAKFLGKERKRKKKNQYLDIFYVNNNKEKNDSLTICS